MHAIMIWTDENFEEQSRRRYEKQLRQFSASHMSNAKWRKVLSAIEKSELKIRKATWKLIDSDDLLDWGVPLLNPHYPNVVADGPPSQPVAFRTIEWIRFPKAGQDIDGLKRVLQEAADVCLKEDAEGLTLFAYSR
jgi:hypothetical protein